MASGGDHSGWEELAVGHALSALEPSDERAFSQHLRDCAICAETVAETLEVMGELAGAVEDVEPPDSLRRGILAGCTSTAASGVADEPPSHREPPADEIAARRGRHESERARGGLRVPWYGVAASVVLVLALVAGNVFFFLANGRQNTDLIRARQVVDCVEERDCRAVPLRATRAGGVPVVAMVTGEDVRLMVDGLRANDATSTTYVLWQKSGKQLRAVGGFDVTGSGASVVTAGRLPESLQDTAFLAVSHEKGNRLPEKPSTPLAVGKISSPRALTGTPSDESPPARSAGKPSVAPTLSAPSGVLRKVPRDRAPSSPGPESSPDDSAPSGGGNETETAAPEPLPTCPLTDCALPDTDAGEILEDGGSLAERAGDQRLRSVPHVVDGALGPVGKLLSLLVRPVHDGGETEPESTTGPAD